MLTREEFAEKVRNGFQILDGATGSNLRKAGMPNGVSTELWVLEHPEPLVRLQRAYAQAGAKIIYAPTFQAQPIALKETINRKRIGVLPNVADPTEYTQEEI